MIKGPYCPATGKPACIDDICRGAGCIKMSGQDVFYYCSDCGEETDKPYCFCTESEYEYYDDYDNESEASE